MKGIDKVIETTNNLDEARKELEFIISELEGKVKSAHISWLEGIAIKLSGVDDDLDDITNIFETVYPRVQTLRNFNTHVLFKELSALSGERLRERMLSQIADFEALAKMDGLWGRRVFMGPTLSTLRRSAIAADDRRLKKEVLPRLQRDIIFYVQGLRDKDDVNE